ncbi:hypothetical protein BDB00DRAFT_812086 [Zychaea mexicana]|uniref:uncharacterized protein n=1 Tax=Zychaea mexicana TaxID=64656 RepID=UPI0022FF17C8|nr:uncharacterized protein BDB00DRAFT_812086 [Zychaea mexicana]KAI9495828.1 hypothetical protein BDB00DRAFT_812086 [Zychaea mexicana]
MRTPISPAIQHSSPDHGYLGIQIFSALSRRRRNYMIAIDSSPTFVQTLILL